MVTVTVECPYCGAPVTLGITGTLPDDVTVEPIEQTYAHLDHCPGLTGPGEPMPVAA